MDINELRIGNYVFYNSEHKEFGFVSGVQEFLTNDGKIAINRRLDIFYDTKDIEPIPITEQYLLDFEFNHNEENNVFELNGFLIYKQDVFWFDLISDSIEIEYVHQLQNLYFALKKEELIKKS